MPLDEVPLHVYLAGPMTGYPGFNFPAFNAAEADLIGRGYTVFNPAIHGAPEHWKPVDYMQRDLAEVCKADMLVMLPDWQYSKHATLEAFVAQWMEIPVLSYPRLEPIKTDPVYHGAWNVFLIMREGLKKHAADSWRSEPEDNHLDKSLRHALTYKLIRDGNQKPDGEAHLRFFHCRAALALTRSMGNTSPVVTNPCQPNADVDVPLQLHTLTQQEG